MFQNVLLHRDSELLPWQVFGLVLSPQTPSQTHKTLSGIMVANIHEKLTAAGLLRILTSFPINRIAANHCECKVNTFLIHYPHFITPISIFSFQKSSLSSKKT